MHAYSLKTKQNKKKVVLSMHVLLALTLSLLLEHEHKHKQKTTTHKAQIKSFTFLITFNHCKRDIFIECCAFIFLLSNRGNFLFLRGERGREGIEMRFAFYFYI